MRDGPKKQTKGPTRLDVRNPSMQHLPSASTIHRKAAQTKIYSVTKSQVADRSLLLLASPPDIASPKCSSFLYNLQRACLVSQPIRQLLLLLPSLPVRISYSRFAAMATLHTVLYVEGCNPTKYWNTPTDRFLQREFYLHLLNCCKRDSHLLG